MKFAVILPSLNEADSIGHVTQVLDQGISQYLKDHEFLIINADGPSTDGTKEVFLSTTTKTQKKYLDCSSQPVVGKGTNILTALEYCIDQYEGFVLIDADLISIDETWIKVFVDPIVNNEAQFISPIYKRNRYEGNTTNHFSSPLIKILTHSHISQPIAGDFAFSKEVAMALLTQPREQSDYQYGIDTLISWTASLGNFSTKEISLDKKIHKPSFGKIVPMFSQVCESTISIIQRNKLEIVNRLTKNNLQITIENCIADDFIVKPDVKKIDLLKQFISTEQERVVSGVYPEKYHKYLIKSSLDENEWSFFLAEILTDLFNKDHSIADLQKTTVSLLTLAYLMRVIGYFYQIEKLSSDEIHQLLQQQTNLTKDKIDVNLSKYLATM